MILKVGLTGGIASGKSTIGRILRELGATVVDADDIVRQLYQPGQRGYELLRRFYGDQILTSDGAIDRVRLSEIAFADPDAANTLNALIHPIVVEEEHRRMRERELEGGPDEIIVVEATLLLESGGKKRYDRIVVVDVEPEEQVRRGVARGMDEGEVRRRMARQLPREERLAAADYVLSSEGSLEETRSRTEELFRKLQDDLEQKKTA